MDLVIRTVAVFLLIMAVTRAVGRRELNSLEPFDMIMLIVIGDLVQQGVTQSDYSLTGATIVISTLAVMTVVMSYVGFRFPRLRPMLEGEAIVLMVDGEFRDRAMRRQRITRDELMAEARQQQIGDLDEIRFAILESNGKVSFLSSG